MKTMKKSLFITTVIIIVCFFGNACFFSNADARTYKLYAGWNAFVAAEKFILSTRPPVYLGAICNTFYTASGEKLGPNNWIWAGELYFLKVAADTVIIETDMPMPPFPPELRANQDSLNTWFNARYGEYPPYVHPKILANNGQLKPFININKSFFLPEPNGQILRFDDRLIVWLEKLPNNTFTGDILCLQSGGRRIIWAPIEYSEMGSGYTTIFKGRDLFEEGRQVVLNTGVNIYHPTYVITEKSLPIGFELGQNYPNPFNPTTTIPFSLENDGIVELAVFDVTGVQVAKLVDTRMMAGSHSVSFDANATLHSTGMYYYRLNVDGQMMTKKMLLVK